MNSRDPSNPSLLINQAPFDKRQEIGKTEAKTNCLSGERVTCSRSIVWKESREGIFEVRRARKFSHERARQLRGSGCLDGRIPPFIFCVATENAATFARNFASMIRLGHSFLPAPFLFPLFSAPFLSLVKPRNCSFQACNRSIDSRSVKSVAIFHFYLIDLSLDFSCD